MQVRVGSMGGRAVLAVALAAVLAGCGQGDDSGLKAATNASPSADGAAAKDAAASGGTVGAAGSACELPVSFDIARHWKAESIDAAKKTSKKSGGSDGDLADALDTILRQGPVTAACEIDAKPAGNIGFIRVWTGKPGDSDAGSVLRRFVAAEGGVSKEKYHAIKTGGGVAGVEVEYLYTSKLLNETKKETAFAVSTPEGPVVVHLGGLDTEEHEAMRPAYELAKRTLRTA